MNHAGGFLTVADMKVGKYEFLNIKNVSRNDMVGIILNNTGCFSDVEKARRIFVPPRLPALCSGFHARNGIYIHIRYAIYFN